MGIALGATLLLYTATYGEAALHTQWEVAPDAGASSLTANPEASIATPLAPFASTISTEPHRYQLPGNSDYRSWATSLPTYRLNDHAASPDQDYLSSADAVKATVQRSWHTIKLAFR